jgi:hypothetical protein
MKKKILGGIVAAAAAGAAGVALASPASAYYSDGFLWRTCDSHAGVVVGTPTSCPFAHNVAAAYLFGDGDLSWVWSPVTLKHYDMTHCDSNYVAHLASGGTRLAALCQGGDDANVIVY